MVRPGRERLSGHVEVDEAYIGDVEDKVHGRETETKAIVAIAVEVENPKGFGRIRLGHVPDVTKESILPFIDGAVQPGSTIHTDGWQAYLTLGDRGYEHERTVMRQQSDPAHVVMPGVHRVASLTPAPQTAALTAACPAGAAALWSALGARFNPAPPDPAATRLARLATTAIFKELPPSYRAAAPFSRLSDNATAGNAFGCALRETIPGLAADPKPPATVTWGAVLSFALRQPLFARALGLIYDFQFAVAPADLLAGGGWIYVQLAAASAAGVNPLALRSYAARLPALDPAPAKARAVFAPVLFPVGLPAAGAYDTPLAEAAVFDDGFAKIVHGAQAVTADAASSGHSKLAPATDAGLDVGWDDEQVTAWFNRQIDGLRARLDPAAAATEAPLGISGYRIDVRLPDDPAGGGWQPLCAAYSADAAGNAAPLVFPPAPAAPAFSGEFDDELTVEPVPVRGLHATDQAAWLPRYFARWQGGSLVVRDNTLLQLTNAAPADAAGNPITAAPSNYAAHPPGVSLRYGTRYELRCRFADLTGGGPKISDAAQNPSPSPTATVRFLRHVAPKALQLSTDVGVVDPGVPTPAIATIKEIDFWRPLIGYPELKYAGIDGAAVVEQLLLNAPAARAAGAAVGVYDPDVTHVRLDGAGETRRARSGSRRAGRRQFLHAVRDRPAFPRLQRRGPVPARRPAGRGPALRRRRRHRRARRTGARCRRPARSDRTGGADSLPGRVCRQAGLFRR